MLLTSLSSRYVLNNFTNYPTTAENYSSTAPTEYEDPIPGTGDHNISKAPTPGTTTRERKRRNRKRRNRNKRNTNGGQESCEN
jgi:hypothetical protein